MNAHPTCTDGIAATSSGVSALVAAYTDCPYCAATSTNPAPGSRRGGATAISEIAKHAAVDTATTVRTRPYRRRSRRYSHSSIAIIAPKCAVA